MKVVVLLYVAVSAVGLHVATGTVVNECTDDIFPDPDSCGNFYKCDNGKPVLFHCPENLFYNKDTKVCDWPNNVKCDVKTGKRPGDSPSGSGHQPSAYDDSKDNDYKDQRPNYEESQTGEYQEGEDGEGSWYPVQTVDAPIINPAPPEVDFSERTRRTVDNLYTSKNNPYQEYADYEREADKKH